MKSIRKLIYGEALSSIAAVTLGFLALFFFFDLVDELQHLGKGNLVEGTTYQLRHALLYVGLLVPGRLYELLPISVLIGTIFVMARLAQSSEYTILRTSGLGPWRALRLLASMGGLFVLLSFGVGDYLVPAADRVSQQIKAHFQGSITVGRTGAWLREKQGSRSFVVNVKSLSPSNELQAVQVFEFDPQGLVVSVTQAASASIADDEAWLLKDSLRTEFEPAAAGSDAAGKVSDKATPNNAGVVRRTRAETLRWSTGISNEMVSVALLKPDRMRTLDLFTYIRHLQANGQSAQRYEIEFWKKVFYPMSCLVMVVLALPFAYMHFRAGGTASYVFGGVMIGISFFLLNNLFGYVGNLQNWEPWLAAAAPGLLYSAISLTAFGWLVLRR
jgi:lipopolysaccharide export system permease protein